MRFHEPFILFRRRNGKRIWYYAIYTPEGERRQYSTGTKSKSGARHYCLELFKRDRLIPKKSRTFADYTSDWFEYDKCLYIKSRLNRGFTYSRSYADGQRSTLTNVLHPYFGKYDLDKITVTLIEKWLSQLKEDGYANISVNHHLSTLKVIFNEAFRRGDISANPVLAVRPLADDCKEKGVFTKVEVQRLFGKNCLETVWGGNEMQYLYNLTASQTGMRIGEIQALLAENVHPDHIDVQHSWDRIYGIKGTKTNKPRQVPITAELYQGLAKLAATQTEGNFVFSGTGGKMPIDHSIVYKWFRRALENIGIPEKTRNERNLTFHSWRHYVNSQLRTNGVPDSIVQSITGHSDLKMTEHYTHVQLSDMGNALKILGNQGGSK